MEEADEQASGRERGHPRLRQLLMHLFTNKREHTNKVTKAFTYYITITCNQIKEQKNASWELLESSIHQITNKMTMNCSSFIVT